MKRLVGRRIRQLKDKKGETLKLKVENESLTLLQERIELEEQLGQRYNEVLYSRKEENDPSQKVKVEPRTRCKMGLSLWGKRPKTS